MKFLKQTRAGWQYALEQREGILLRMLIEDFSPSTAASAKISKTGTGPKSAERECLLNESLADHRQELKVIGMKLLAKKLKPMSYGWKLSLTGEERESLLQLLNDVRVESWHGLGGPDDLEATLPASATAEQLRHQQVMHLAGYFEWKLIDPAKDDS